MGISRRTQAAIGRTSWIRAVFEEGLRLKEELGPENVFDFSLGNPSAEPPEAFFEALAEEAADRTPGRHRYMPNAGLPGVRCAIADHLASAGAGRIPADHVVMCTGAGCGCNVVLQTLLDPEDEVIVLAPYFLEYEHYLANYDARMVVVPTDTEFLPDVDAIAAAITPRTKAVLVDSPNNPTGVVYPRDRLEALGAVLASAERALGHEIYLLSDEPYRHLVYEPDVEVPWMWEVHPNSIVVTSHSKDLGLAGERIGYVIVGPECADAESIVGGMIFALRALGFVNAPALMQRVVARIQDARVDLTLYRTNREVLVSELRRIGYEFPEPRGAFYLFPRSPLEDELEFVARLREERILVVPGRGFGTPGHFRISYAVDPDVCQRALPGFARAFHA
jgi:aspartate aminotransferase